MFYTPREEEMERATRAVKAKQSAEVLSLAKMSETTTWEFHNTVREAKYNIRPAVKDITEFYLSGLTKTFLS